MTATHGLHMHTSPSVPPAAAASTTVHTPQRRAHTGYTTTVVTRYISVYCSCALLTSTRSTVSRRARPERLLPLHANTAMVTCIAWKGDASEVEYVLK